MTAIALVIAKMEIAFWLSSDAASILIATIKTLSLMFPDKNVSVSLPCGIEPDREVSFTCCFLVIFKKIINYINSLYLIYLPSFE